MSSDFPPVIILAGGIATRLGDISKQTPKAMMPIGGIPFIDYVLRLLQEQGINQVLMSVAHLGKQIEEYVGDGSRYKMQVEYVYDGPIRLGTGGAIKSALGLVPESFAVLYGDTFLDIHYKPVFEAFKNSGKDALMTVLRNENSWDRSNVLFENGVIEVYDKHAPSEKMKHIDYGLSLLHKSCFNDFAADEPFDLAELFARRVKEGKMAGFEVSTRFYEIGTQSSLVETEKYLMSRTFK